MPGSLQGNYSRFMFDEEKRYVYTLFQRAFPGVDADFNDVLPSIYTQMRRVIEYGIGDGSPNDGFKLEEATAPSNNFQIDGGDGTLEGAGRLFFNGYCCMLKDDVDYVSNTPDIHPQSTALSETVLTDSSGNWITNEFNGRYLTPDISTPGNTYLVVSNTATTITVVGGSTMLSDGAAAGDFYRVELSTPGGSRTDEVYVDVFLDEITETEDPNLIHPSLVPPGPFAYRAQLRQNVWVRENGTTPTSPFTDADSRVHFYYKIATLARTATANVLTAMITDERRAFNPGGGGIDIREQDGSPIVSSVNEIKVTNGSLTDDGGGVVSLELNNLTIEEQDSSPSVSHTNKIIVPNGSLTDLGSGVVELDAGGGSTSGDVSRYISFVDDIPAITPPTPGTIGTDIDTLDHPDGSETGQKIEFTVPDDYDSGDLTIRIGFATSAAVASPNNVVVLRTWGEIADTYGGSINAIASSDDVLTCPDNSTDVTYSVIRNITEGTFVAGDRILLNITRRGADAGDLLTANLQIFYYGYGYFGTVAGRINVLDIQAFRDTDETPPANGTIGTDIDTLDFSPTVDNEQKFFFAIPDNYDGISDIYIRLNYGMSTSGPGDVVLETEGEIADVSSGSITALSVVQYVLTPPTDTDPHRSVSIRVVPYSVVGAGDQLTIKLARRGSDGGDTHGGNFQLVNATVTVGIAPSSGITQATIWDEYMTFVGFKVVSGTVSGDMDEIDFTDEEAYWLMSSTASTGEIHIQFAGRLGPTQTTVKRIKVPLKGSGASPQYNLKVYVSGQGGTPVYASGDTAAPPGHTELSLNDTHLSSQPDANGKFFVVVEAKLDTSENLYVGPIQAGQE